MNQPVHMHNKFNTSTKTHENGFHSPRRGSTGLDLSVWYQEKSTTLGRDTATITGTSEMECHYSCSI
jgi:hypothetical protein